MPTQKQDLFASRAPNADDLVAIGQSILRELPAEIRPLIGDVTITVTDWPDSATLDEMDIEDALGLTGLYRAIPIADRLGSGLPPSEPEMIFLYRLPILVEWAERGCSLWEVVFDVLTHEIGHHLGMDEAAVLQMEGRS